MRHACKNLKVTNTWWKELPEKRLSNTSRWFLKRSSSAELVDALKPALQDIDDLERLEDLYIQAIHAQSLQAFAQKLI